MSASGTTGDGFKVRLDEIRARIERAAGRAGRPVADITLVAVSKTVPVARMQGAMACGCLVFGESRVQEALAKMEALGAGDEVQWHLIAPLQTNKVNSVVGRFELIHAIDRLEIAERLDRAVRARGLVQNVLLEVNVAGETSKHGFAPESLLREVEKIGAFSGLRVLGLMAIPPAAPDSEAVRPHFRKVRELAAEVDAQRIPGLSMSELSMGMSGDFEVAIEEGATMVRIGTALFGERS